jgi:hypothetical protein
MVSSGLFLWHCPYGLFQISASLFISHRYVLDLLNLPVGRLLSRTTLLLSVILDEELSQVVGNLNSKFKPITFLRVAASNSTVTQLFLLPLSV